MEDSKKNKERKVLTDDELEQVSGGRLAFSVNGYDYFPCDVTPWKDYCVYYKCHWSDKLNKCFYNATDAANEEAKLGASGVS